MGVMFPESLVDGMFMFSPRAEGIGAKVIRSKRIHLIYFWIMDTSTTIVGYLGL